MLAKKSASKATYQGIKRPSSLYRVFNQSVSRGPRMHDAENTKAIRWSSEESIQTRHLLCLASRHIV